MQLYIAYHHIGIHYSYLSMFRHVDIFQATINNVVLHNDMGVCMYTTTKFTFDGANKNKYFIDIIISNLIKIFLKF